VALSASQFVGSGRKKRALASVVNYSIIDNAILTGKLAANLGTKIAEAVLPLGLPASSLTAFIGDLAANNDAALAKVPKVTPEIIEAGVGGLFEAYSIAFKFIWVAAACFMVFAAVGKTSLHFSSRKTKIDSRYSCIFPGRPN